MNSKDVIKIVCCFLFIFNLFCCGQSEFKGFENVSVSLEEAIRLKEKEEMGSFSSRVLSRKRRYLVFPEGSSFQLVFCLTYGMYLQISDIFYMGATAALAWQLPQDPYDPFNHHAEALHRSDDEEDLKADSRISSPVQVGRPGSILINRFTGQPIQPRDKLYYDSLNRVESPPKKEKPKAKKRKKIFPNPAFAKRSVDDLSSNSTSKRNKRAAVMSVDRGQMHKYQEKREHLNTEHMTSRSIEFHRSSRRMLYEKIEKLMRGLGRDGRHCVLKTLCEFGQDKSPQQGSFLDEIIRVIFTLPDGRQFEELHHQKYDEAHRTKHRCDDLYPKCDTSLKGMPLR